MESFGHIFTKLLQRAAEAPGGSLSQGHFLTLVAELARQERVSAETIYAEMISEAMARRSQQQLARARWSELSAREQQVAALACLDLTNRQIGSKLLISNETVKSHIRSVLLKFDLHSKDDLRRMLGNWDFSVWLEPPAA